MTNLDDQYGSRLSSEPRSVGEVGSCSFKVHSACNRNLEVPHVQVHMYMYLQYMLPSKHLTVRSFSLWVSRVSLRTSNVKQQENGSHSKSFAAFRT